MSRVSNRRQASEAPRRWRGAPLTLALAILAGACAPRSDVAPRPVSSPTPAGPAHAPELRLALVGQLSEESVWGLFDGRGQPYNDYAVRSQYWPRLFAASIPDEALTPLLAAAAPSPVRQEGVLYTASVPVRSDLTWTDGTPFTSRDVAFSVNTALAFDLGFDWRDYYDPVVLDHADATEPGVVKFFFKSPPSVESWQYGALRGPVVQEAFWSPRVAAAAEALPGDELTAGMQALREKIALFQEEVNALYAATFVVQGEGARQVQADLRRQQGNLDEATNDLAEAEASFDAAMYEARRLLYALEDEGEPLLGRWLPQDVSVGIRGAAAAVNVPNLAFPGPTPNFDRTSYRLYATRLAADRALAGGEVHLILDPAPAMSDPSPSAMTSPTRQARFLVFGARSGPLSDAALRRAVACTVDQHELSAAFLDRATKTTSFVSNEQAWWYNAGALLPCAGLDAQSRLLQAVEILKGAGYTWEREPSIGTAGRGLTRPDGLALAPMQLLAPAEDESRAAAAAYVVQQSDMLGLPISVQAVTQDVIDYAVLSSRDFEMAVLGWRLSPYPGYLCGWFGPAGPFAYDSASLTSLCGELAATSDLEAARPLLHQVQQVLAADVPMLPLYSMLIHEDLNGITYPFSTLLDGLAGAYGAPESAIPAVP